MSDDKNKIRSSSGSSGFRSSVQLKALQVLCDPEHFRECRKDADVMTSLGCPADPVAIAVRRGYVSRSEIASTIEQFGNLTNGNADPDDGTMFFQRFLSDVVEGSMTNAPGAPGKIEQHPEQVGDGTHKYRVDYKLGEGALGSSYRVAGNGGNVARRLKVIDVRRLADQRDVELALDKADRVHANMAHPCAARVTQFARVRHCVMILEEYEHGITLDVLLRRRRKLSERTAMELLRQVALGVLEGHKRGLPHGGIKTENILIGVTGRIMSIDWSAPPSGLLQAAGRILPGQKARHASGVEYLSRRLLKELDVPGFADDMHALGILLFSMLAGRMPYAPDPKKVLWELEHLGLPKLSEFGVSVTPRTAELLKKMTASNPGEGFTDMRECLTDIEAALGTLRTMDGLPVRRMIRKRCFKEETTTTFQEASR